MATISITAFVHLHTPIKEFVKAIPKVMEGKPFCCSVNSRIFNQSETDALLILIAGLSKIELQEYYNWKNGHHVKECASIRNVSTETIKTERARITEKFKKTGLLYLLEKKS